MGRTSYDFNQHGTQSQEVYDNPTFVIGESQVITPPTLQSGEFPPAKETRKFQEIPLSRVDVIKLGLLVAFMIGAFVVGVVVTGANV